MPPTRTQRAAEGRPGESDDLNELVSVADSGTFGEGPWVASLWVTVPGRVLSKSNYRNSAKKSTWGGVAGYEHLVHQVVRGARPRGWPSPDPSLPPTARPKIVVVLAARTGLDAGNLSKSVLDACEAALYVSDAQVGCLTDLVVAARANQGLFAAFAALDADTTTTEMLSAHSELISRLATMLEPRTDTLAAPAEA